MLVGSHLTIVSLLGSSVKGLLSDVLHGLMLPDFIIFVNEQEANLTEPLPSVVSVLLSMLVFDLRVFCHLHHLVLEASNERPYSCFLFFPYH